MAYTSRAENVAQQVSQRHGAAMQRLNALINARQEALAKQESELKKQYEEEKRYREMQEDQAASSWYKVGGSGALLGAGLGALLAGPGGAAAGAGLGAAIGGTAGSALGMFGETKNRQALARARGEKMGGWEAFGETIGRAPTVNELGGLIGMGGQAAMGAAMMKKQGMVGGTDPALADQGTFGSYSPGGLNPPGSDAYPPVQAAQAYSAPGAAQSYSSLEEAVPKYGKFDGNMPDLQLPGGDWNFTPAELSVLKQFPGPEGIQYVKNMRGIQ